MPWKLTSRILAADVYIYLGFDTARIYNLGGFGFVGKWLVILRAFILSDEIQTNETGMCSQLSETLLYLSPM